MLSSIFEIYVPESKLPYAYPEEGKEYLITRMLEEWDIFSGDEAEVGRLIHEFVSDSFALDTKLLTEKVGIPKLYDEAYLNSNAIMGKYSWDIFKRYIRNENRFHSKYIQLDVLALTLKETEILIPEGMKFYRARISDKFGYPPSKMGASPKDIATPGRANSKGQSCLYLCSTRKTTVKEIRARAFDYVTIATFKLNRQIKVLDLSAIGHISPFHTNSDKVAYLINEHCLRQIQDDMAKPMSRLDSDLDYLPTQYISDFAKYLGYDGVKYLSTFDETSYNIALFDASACDCTYRRNYLIDNLDYKMNAL